ncbi:MAG: glycosyltransferase [Ginsengibacter sp.]
MSKRIIVSVTSDLVTDQRVQKECNTLHKMGYEVLVLGRKSKRGFLLNDLAYRTVRFNVPFRRGPLMYLTFNAQLFFYLLFNKADILWSNDLDTLLPNFLVSRMRGCKLVYDSHEYFTESVYKLSSRKVWEMVEKWIFPGLRNVITVNDSIKKVYEKKYRVPVTVIRNVPYKYMGDDITTTSLFPAGKKILLIQGMGINENRGAEEAVLMMPYLPDNFNLYFIGSGTVLPRLKQMVNDLKLESNIIFIDAMPYLQMMDYTRQSFLGLIFEKIDTTDEHLFSLPNKFFDYIHAGIPVLSSRAVEIQSIILQYGIGDLIDNFDPKEIAQKIIDISKNEERYRVWKHNTIKASEELNWENEEKTLIDFMHHLR